MSGVRSEKALEQIEIKLGEVKDDSVDLPDYKNDSDREMPTMDIDGVKYIGLITIDSIGLKLPVINEYSKKNLDIAPVLYSGSIYKNNAVIIAHNNSSHFRKIGKLKVGDIVTFVDADGDTFKYEVIGQSKVFEEDSSKIDEGEWDLTLFSCTPSNIKFRTVVRLKRI